MSVKQTRVSLKGMTDEEKRQHNKVKMREYMNRRRKEDPEFAEKLRENCRKAREKADNPKDGYDLDKRKQYNKQYYIKKKQQLKQLEDLKNYLNIAK